MFYSAFDELIYLLGALPLQDILLLLPTVLQLLLALVTTRLARLRQHPEPLRALLVLGPLCNHRQGPHRDREYLLAIFLPSTRFHNDALRDPRNLLPFFAAPVVEGVFTAAALVAALAAHTARLSFPSLSVIVTVAVRAAASLIIISLLATASLVIVALATVAMFVSIALRAAALVLSTVTARALVVVGVTLVVVVVAGVLIVTFRLFVAPSLLVATTMLVATSLLIVATSLVITAGFLFVAALVAALVGDDCDRRGRKVSGEYSSGSFERRR